MTISLQRRQQNSGQHHQVVEQQKELELKLKATEAAEENACELEGQLTAKKARAQQAPGRKRNIEL